MRNFLQRQGDSAVVVLTRVKFTVVQLASCSYFTLIKMLNFFIFASTNKRAISLHPWNVSTYIIRLFS